MNSPRRDMRARHEKVLAVLADGRFHSGEQIARQLRVSRSAIWKLVKSLRGIRIDVQSVPRQGYRLARAVDLLSAKTIMQKISRDVGAALERCDVLLEVDSTNRHLANDAPPAADRGRVCLAEVQSAGRGRRGRTWVAPFGSGLCISVAWTFGELPATLSALSLAVGVAIVRALKVVGATDVKLKWPNDVVWKDRKLAGVLVEVRGETSGPTDVVIGIGMNVRMPAATRVTLAEQHAVVVADLHEVLGSSTPDRNIIAACLIEQMVGVLREFAASGFASLADEWRELDSLRDAPVRVLSGAQVILGTARGVAADGALLVEADGAVSRYVSADVSLRPVRP